MATTETKPLHLTKHADGNYTFVLYRDRDYGGPCVYSVTRHTWTKAEGPTDLRWKVRPEHGESRQRGYRYFATLRDVRQHYAELAR
jgi:hypothetical protein